MTEIFNPLRIPLQGNTLIEASAGTGKTYTIALLYVRLVLGPCAPDQSGQAFDPTQILVVTFTKAAAQELCERIMCRLRETCECFSAADAKHDPVLEQLRADYPKDAWPNCAARLKAALESMDQAAIATIHSWCYGVLQTHAFVMGELFSQRLVTQQTNLFQSLIEDYWRRFCYPLTPAQAALYAESYASPEVLTKDLSALLRYTNSQYSYAKQPLLVPESIGALLDERLREKAEQTVLEQNARDLWRAHTAELESLLWGVREQLNGNNYKGCKKVLDFERWLAKLAAWSTGGPQPDKLKLLGQQRFVLNKSTPAPEHEAFIAIDAYYDCCEQKVDTTKQLLRIHALQQVAADFSTQQQRRAELGFDDVLARLAAALSNANAQALVAKIRAQYPVALIDEFQDTDPIQLKIFARLFPKTENSLGGLFLIGDPKQSIYGFRGSSMTSYLRARTELIHRQYSLETNFRSTQSLVQAVNHLFDYAEQKYPAGAFRYKAQLPFQKVKAKGRTEKLLIQGTEQRALTFWGAQASTKALLEKTIAAATASSIRTWLDSQDAQHAYWENDAGDTRPVRPEEIAILVKDVVQAQLIQQALARCGLASVYLSAHDSVLHTAQAADLLLILQACAQPTYKNKVTTALATGSLARSWQELAQIEQDDRYLQEQMLRFHGYRQQWQRTGILPMLRRLFWDFAIPQRCSGLPCGERVLTNLLHLADWLHAAAASLPDQKALLEHFAAHIQEKDHEELLSLESDGRLIKVITMHSSKGLEYPLVLLPFLGVFKKDPSDNFLVYYPPGSDLPAVDFSSKDSPQEAAVRQEALNEKLRLLYVALTRARHAVWVGVDLQRPKEPTFVGTALDYVLNGDVPLKSGVVQAALEKLCAGCTQMVYAPLPESTGEQAAALEVTELGEARIARRTIIPDWSIVSYSKLRPEHGAAVYPTTSTVLLEPVDSLESVVSFDAFESFGLGRGAQVGSFLHHLFEKAGHLGFSKVAAEHSAFAAFIQQHCAAFSSNLKPLQPIELESLYRWFRSYLKAPFSLLESECSFAQLTTYQVEMEFLFASAAVDVAQLDKLVTEHTLGGEKRTPLEEGGFKGLCTGAIDLVFEHAGRYYLADYKSSWLADYARASIQADMLVNRYDLQYSLYVLALHRQLRVRLPHYNYDQHMGGALYLYLRVMPSATQGLFFERPQRSYIEALDRLFKGVPG